MPLFLRGMAGYFCEFNVLHEYSVQVTLWIRDYPSGGERAVISLVHSELLDLVGSLEFGLVEGQLPEVRDGKVFGWTTLDSILRRNLSCCNL